MAQPAGLPEFDGNAIGYASPKAALADLQTRPDVRFTSNAGVTYASDRARLALWAFTRVPGTDLLSAVKQQVLQDGTRVLVKTSVLCNGSKQACDELVMQSLSRLKTHFPNAK